MASFEHPYVPKDLELHGYVPCFLSQSEIVAPYLGVSVVVVALVWILSGLSICLFDSLLLNAHQLFDEIHHRACL